MFLTRNEKISIHAAGDEIRKEGVLYPRVELGGEAFAVNWAVEDARRLEQRQGLLIRKREHLSEDKRDFLTSGWSGQIRC